ncbi:MAG: IS200/IS605 family transposase [Elusimicrobia bacterium]|nr:IS200/IS605 family transposase [Elusimicrobiota bacterium]
MGYRRSSHAVYDTKYHIVWIPKYRKEIFAGRPGERLKEIFVEIAEQYGMEIDTMEVMPDHVHLFLSFPPKYSISEAVKILKNWSARRMFEEFKWLERKLWGGELWGDGYFVRTVGDKVTADVIRRYLEYQKHEDSSSQLELF